MSVSMLLAVVLICAAVFYVLGNRRAIGVSGGDSRQLHSRPNYYGILAALWFAIPAIAVIVVWQALQGHFLEGGIVDDLPPDVLERSADQVRLVVATIKSLAFGGIASGVEPYMLESAAGYRSAHGFSQTLMSIMSLALGLLVAGTTVARITPQTRARNGVERIIKALLIACASLAILTTAGIVLSMLFETINFFKTVPLSNFFFSTEWDPRFSSAGRDGGDTGQFGMIPLMVGTMYVAFVAMLVAVPIGLLAAMYLAEYATPKFRATAKPMLEILAGIPTVVYGFFALVTVGPFLRDTGDIMGLDIDARSVMTAGIVMGIMIIPFISSLSDDVITQVPRSLREGSLGLGATKSETIRKVIFPAALPGIVGSILLAASRAIGETMIVVMAAGVAANLSGNPFEPMTTVTVKIVNQLTGDNEFTSPQTLVAFALGMTLFVITLGLNIFALHIVRKYREQYD
ncbi:MAG: phosphate ABC transporter permease subunit PstC [Alphaproteobacteria bacterium]|uniref:phosphate ABC transporter permease subunit PstC n=1 Tax=Pacificispira sp. TaxID=2888761 RepID=UPI001B21EDFB|nr:phosphate ABC transporter permease subunit PstC [Alphaproteobacteria bacterium]MBO6861634.1 phosphate ABC transporter permease subunit PstC [Alphaproteobacteria bacterium]